MKNRRQIAFFSIFVGIFFINSTHAIMKEQDEISPTHPNLVALLKPESSGKKVIYCSGVAINNYYVLTAAHCLIRCDPSGCDEKTPIANLAVATGAGAEDGHIADTVPQKTLLAWRAHPDFRNGERHHSHDLAVIRLREPLENMQELFIQENPSLTALTEIQMDGYGMQEDPNTGDWMHDGLANSVSFPLIEVGKNSERFSTYLDANWNELFIADALNIRSTCKGDSGGPIWGKTHSETQLLALTTSGVYKHYYLPTGEFIGKCGSPSTGVWLPAHKKWIEKIISEI